MKQNTESHIKTHRTAIITAMMAVMALVLLIGLFFFIRNFILLNKQGSFEAIRHPRQYIFRKLSPNFHNTRRMRTENIAGWMTFDFINRTFGLPAEFLRDRMGITDKKYPNISIDAWAKIKRIKVQQVIEEAKGLIQNLPSPMPSLMNNAH